VDPDTVSLLVIGCAALLVLTGSLVFGGLSHELVHDLASDLASDVANNVASDVGEGHDGGGHFSLPAIATFIGGFGFFGAIGHHLVGGGNGVWALVATGVSGISGAQLAATFAVRLSRMLARMPTDATLTADDLLAASGVVITPIGADTFGEVRVHVGGLPLKVYAQADRALPLGTKVFVVEARTESSVIVVEADGSP
jgi:hypothetical protein